MDVSASVSVSIERPVDVAITVADGDGAVGVVIFEDVDSATVVYSS